MKKEAEPVRIDGLKHEDIVIGTSKKRFTGSNNLCVIIDVVEGFMQQEQQFIMSMSEEHIKKEGSPGIFRMHDAFDFNAHEDDVKEHKMYKPTLLFIEPFFEVKFGDRIPDLKTKDGIPVYIGKDPENIHVAYISAEGIDDGDFYPTAKFPIAQVIQSLDAGKRKIRVRYINIEDDTVTVVVASMDRITDMKKLLYQIGA
jgi:hypothetical protein